MIKKGTASTKKVPVKKEITVEELLDELIEESPEQEELNSEHEQKQKEYTFPVAMCPEASLFKDGSILYFQIEGRRRGDQVLIQAIKRIG